MKIIDIVKLVNTYLAGEHLTYQKMLPYLDATIDDINDKLNSSYPPFSALPYTSDTATTIAYNMFPDKYIRSVVAPGDVRQSNYPPLRNRSPSEVRRQTPPVTLSPYLELAAETPSIQKADRQRPEIS